MDYDPFFRSATSVESRASPKRGGGGGAECRSDTFLCSETFFLRFKRGGGGNCTKQFQRGGGGGTGRVCPPPPKSATGSIHPCPNHNDDYCVENLMPFHGTNFSLTGGGGVKMWVGEVHCIIENYCYVKV